MSRSDEGALNAPRTSSIVAALRAKTREIGKRVSAGLQTPESGASELLVAHRLAAERLRQRGADTEMAVELVSEAFAKMRVKRSDLAARLKNGTITMREAEAELNRFQSLVTAHLREHT